MTAHDTLKIKPAEGRRVRDPATGRPLPAAGETVPRNTYWDRRLADADVVLITGKPGKEA